MGYTRSSQYIYFNLLPGNHTIYSKAENWAVIEIHAKTGDIIFIEQESEMGAFMPRNNLTRLKDYEGKYHVKNLTVGTILKTDK